MIEEIEKILSYVGTSEIQICDIDPRFLTRPHCPHYRSLLIVSVVRHCEETGCGMTHVVDWQLTQMDKKIVWRKGFVHYVLTTPPLSPQNEQVTNRNRNIAIISEISSRVRGIDSRRRNFAIYRLYRYCNLSPREISEVINCRKSTVERIIGRVFKENCAKDQKCPFKKFFIQR